MPLRLSHSSTSRHLVLSSNLLRRCGSCLGEPALSLSHYHSSVHAALASLSFLFSVTRLHFLSSFHDIAALNRAEKDTCSPQFCYILSGMPKSHLEILQHVLHTNSPTIHRRHFSHRRTVHPPQNHAFPLRHSHATRRQR